MLEIRNAKKERCKPRAGGMGESERNDPIRRLGLTPSEVLGSLCSPSRSGESEFGRTSPFESSEEDATTEIDGLWTKNCRVCDEAIWVWDDRVSLCRDCLLDEEAEEEAWSSDGGDGGE